MITNDATQSDQPSELRVAQYRDLMSLWVANCNCGGPQPSPTDTKAGQHRFDCDYVQRLDGGDVNL